MNILDYFGEVSDSARMEALYQALNTLKRPELPDEDDPPVYYDWLLVRRLGIELGFAEEHYFRGHDLRRWGRGRLLLVQAYYYAGFDDVERCSWPLPHGITWEDTREQVRARLAEAAATLHSSPLSDTWDLPNYRLTVKYAGEPLRAERIACSQREAALLPPKGAEPPDWDKIVGHLGRSIEEPEWRALWGGWLDDEALEEGEEDGSIDLLDSYGASLMVEAESGSLRLRGIRLHTMRDQDISVGWRGALPHGLSFEDSPDRLFEKIKAKPVQSSYDNLTGHAVWEFASYRLHVLFSTVENRLLRVSLRLPEPSPDED